MSNFIKSERITVKMVKEFKGILNFFLELLLESDMMRDQRIATLRRTTGSNVLVTLVTMIPNRYKALLVLFSFIIYVCHKAFT